jgi:Leu/Phe-tRNA-protein transferase
MSLLKTVVDGGHKSARHNNPGSEWWFWRKTRTLYERVHETLSSRSLEIWLGKTGRDE